MDMMMMEIGLECIINYPCNTLLSWDIMMEIRLGGLKANENIISFYAEI